MEIGEVNNTLLTNKMVPLHMVPVATPYSKEQNLAKFYLDIEILFDRYFSV